MPVQKRYWQQHELWDGTYTVGDWLDLIEKIPEFEQDFISLLKGFNFR